MFDKDWSSKDTLFELVRQYKMRPVLWDHNHDLFKAQDVKYEAYTELAAIFECHVVELRKKLNSILASYRREKMKLRYGSRSTWFLYNHLSFLPGHLEKNNKQYIKGAQKTKNPTDSEKEEEEEEHEEVVLENIDDEEEVVIKREFEPTNKKAPRTFRQPRPRITKTKPIVKEVTTSQLDNRLLLKMLRRSELAKKKDECDSFGEYIAVSLRKHDERTQSMIKQAINNILFEQEMKKCNATHYVVLSEIDENPLNFGDNDNSDK